MLFHLCVSGCGRYLALGINTLGLAKTPVEALAFFPDDSEKNLNCSFIFDWTHKSNASLESVKGLLLFVYAHHINKTLCFCKKKRINKVYFQSSQSPLISL